MLMQAETRATLLGRTLRSGWWTMPELADLAQCSTPQAWKLTKRIAQQVIVFRRQRVSKGKLYEYRVFPRAIQVCAVPSPLRRGEE